MLMLRHFLIIFLLFSCQQQQKSFTIGSGSESAMYFPAATTLCDTFNKYKKETSPICIAKISKGAEFNLDSVENGHFDMGISQANLQYDAYLGKNNFAGNPHKNLRTLARVHNEYFTIIAKNHSKISNLQSTKGKIVNVGNQGAGSPTLFTQMIRKFGWTLSDFKKTYDKSGSEIDEVLCKDGDADAAIYLVGHPNKSFDKILKNCDTHLVSLSQSEIDLFSSISNQFWAEKIPAKTYSNQDVDIKTFASKTILSTSRILDQSLVREFTGIISQHKDEIIKKQPSLSPLEIFITKQKDMAPIY